MYRLGDARPTSLADLAGKTLVVRAGSRHAEMLADARVANPGLTFNVAEKGSAEQVLTLIEQGDADYALINSNAYVMHRALFPDLASGFTLNRDQGLAWAFDVNDDQSLYLAAQRYLTQVKADGTTRRLADRFYGHLDQFDLYAARSFIRHLDDRLPNYTADFRQAAESAGFDWRLLAAMAYQESLWDAQAISPPGSRADDADQPHRPGDGHQRPHRPGPEHPRRRRLSAPATRPHSRAHPGAGPHLDGPGRLQHGHGPPGRRPRADPAPGRRSGPLAGRENPAHPARRPGLREPAPLRRRPGGQAAVYVRHIRHYYDLLVRADNSERHGQTLLATSE